MIDLEQRMTNVIKYLAGKPVENSKQIQNLLQQQDELKTMIDHLDGNYTKENLEKFLDRIELLEIGLQEQLIPIELEMKSGNNGTTVKTITTTNYSTNSPSTTTYVTTTTKSHFDPKLLEEIKTILLPCQLKKLDDNDFNLISCDIKYLKYFTGHELKDKFSNLSIILSEEQKNFKIFEMIVGRYGLNFIENQFIDINFENISLINWYGNIDMNVFNGTNSFTKILQFDVNYIEYDKVSKVINTFEKLEELWLKGFTYFNLSKTTFDKMKELKQITLYSGTVQDFTGNVFFNQEKLESLYFADISTKIPDFAFEIEKESNDTLYIHFDNIDLDVLSNKTFLKTGRPTTLTFDKTFSELEENKFKKFLENIDNWIDINSIDCNDCNNYWLKNYKERIIGDCSNGKLFNDKDNFKICSIITDY